MYGVDDQQQQHHHHHDNTPRTLKKIMFHSLSNNNEFQITSPYCNIACSSVLDAAISPSGDAVAVVESVMSTIRLSLMIRNTPTTFVASQYVNISPRTSFYMDSMLAQHIHNNNQNNHDDDDDDANNVHDLSMRTYVKKHIQTSFSNCGKYVSVMDRCPKYGHSIQNSSLVLVDAGLRMENKKGTLPFMSMFDDTYQAPRGLVWTDNSIWLMPPGTTGTGTITSAGGILCISNSKIFDD